MLNDVYFVFQMMEFTRTCVSALLLWLSVVHGYRSGAPMFACETMTPGHNGMVPQTRASPYTIAAAKPQTDRGKVKVMVSSPSGETFAGFFLQARAGSSNSSMGTFTQVPGEAHTVNCGSGSVSAHLIQVQ